MTDVRDAEQEEKRNASGETRSKKIKRRKKRRKKTLKSGTRWKESGSD
jgi:hypothetical protein